VKLAARGQRDMDAGPEAIADRAELEQVRRQARAIYAKSLAAAAVLTALALVA
jgi:beta-lactamase regulating signal transducer with metallopeptidase domain